MPRLLKRKRSFSVSSGRFGLPMVISLSCGSTEERKIQHLVSLTQRQTQRQTHSDRQVHALGLIANEDIDALLCRVQDPAAAARAAAEGSVFPRPNAYTRDTMGRERVWPCRPSELVRIHCAQKCDRTDISR